MYASTTSSRPRCGLGVRFHRSLTLIPDAPCGSLETGAVLVGTQPYRYHASPSQVAPGWPFSAGAYCGSLGYGPPGWPVHDAA